MMHAQSVSPVPYVLPEMFIVDESRPSANAEPPQQESETIEAVSVDPDSIESQAEQFSINIVDLLSSLDSDESSLSTIEALLASFGFDEFIEELQRSTVSED